METGDTKWEGQRGRRRGVYIHGREKAYGDRLCDREWGGGKESREVKGGEGIYKMDSDHHPLEVWIKGERRYREGARRGGMI